MFIEISTLSFVRTFYKGKEHHWRQELWETWASWHYFTNSSISWSRGNSFPSLATHSKSSKHMVYGEDHVVYGIYIAFNHVNLKARKNMTQNCYALLSWCKIVMCFKYIKREGGYLVFVGCRKSNWNILSEHRDCVCWGRGAHSLCGVHMLGFVCFSLKKVKKCRVGIR